MLENFQLAAIVKQGGQMRVLRIPLHQDLQQTLAANWHAQLDAFLGDVQEIEFNAGYQPEEHECFGMEEFDPPGWLASETSETAGDLDPITQNEALLNSIKGCVVS